MDDFKIKNLTPEQSRVVQETVFKNGGSWVSGKIKVQETRMPMLYLTNKILTYGQIDEVFNENPNPEITFEEFERKYITKLPPHISELPYVEMEVRDYEHDDWLIRKVVCLTDDGCFVISNTDNDILQYYQYRPIQTKTTITKQQIAEKFGVKVENLIITE